MSGDIQVETETLTAAAGAMRSDSQDWLAAAQGSQIRVIAQAMPGSRSAGASETATRDFIQMASDWTQSIDHLAQGMEETAASFEAFEAKLKGILANPNGVTLDKVSGAGGGQGHGAAGSGASLADLAGGTSPGSASLAAPPGPIDTSGHRPLGSDGHQPSATPQGGERSNPFGPMVNPPILRRPTEPDYAGHASGGYAAPDDPIEPGDVWRNPGFVPHPKGEGGIGFDPDELDPSSVGLGRANPGPFYRPGSGSGYRNPEPGEYPSGSGTIADAPTGVDWR